ncbi:uncharacterized protein LOC132284730 [Cornus florida]|uniref:uncharacterized protein LOC132284730 n=1 Tax=Cornus florida TaxID=4283 RepID=UPI00289A8D7E|nr:uncharacterized protein LOC132284730 [Cornus florida]
MVQKPKKSRVAIFVVLATVVRQKPEVLISLFPVMAKDPKYQVHQDKQKITIWLVAQAFEGNLIVGLFMWVRLLLPMLSYSNRQNRCLILKLMERILSVPKARSVLLNGVVWNGERVVPPWALELLMRIAFPVYLKDKVKATQRFEAVYRTLKKIALACSPGSKEMKQITGEILQFAIKAVGEHKCIHGLTDEATNIFIWCLTQNQDCYKQWEDLYLDNIEASVYILDKLYNGLEEHSVKHYNLQSLKTSLKSFRQKNSKALAIRNKNFFRYAERYCELISTRLSWYEPILRRYDEVLGYVLLAAGAGGVAALYRNIQLLFTMT